MSDLQKRKLYDTDAPNKSTKIVNGESSNILNWNDIRFPWASTTYKNQVGNFWTSDEVNMSNDIKQFPQLSKEEQESFLKIIGLLAFLDSVQTDLSGKVAEYLTDSSLVANMQVLSFFEVIHNQSYSYVLSSIVGLKQQLETFDYWRTDKVLLERNQFIADGYNEFVENPSPQTLFKTIVYDICLEGIFFYSGFAFFYHLAREGKMMGTNQMISYINRDEEIHVGLFAKIFRALLDDYPELNTEENIKWAVDTLKKAAELEITWGNHIIRAEGIDLQDFAEYIRFVTNKRAIEIGVERPFSRSNRNPLPWIRYYENIDDAKVDFFEGKPRQYTKVDDDNGFDEL